MRQIKLNRKKLRAGLVFIFLVGLLAACGESTAEQATFPPAELTSSSIAATVSGTPAPTNGVSTPGSSTVPANSEIFTQTATSTAPALSATPIPHTPTAMVTTLSPTPTPQVVSGLTPTVIAPTLAPGHNGLQTLWRTEDGGERLRFLNGLATDSSNNLYLSNSYPNIIRKYDQAGHLLFQLPQDLTGVLATDRQDNLYVLSNETVFEFDPGGKPLFNFKVERPGSGPFGSLSGLALDEKGIIYILDEAGRVYKFDKTGRYLSVWGKPGDPSKIAKPGELATPLGLVADRQGHIYVADTLYNHRIQKFDLNGKFLLAFGTSGDGDGQFGEYTLSNGLGTDKAGNVYVIDYDNKRIEKFNPQGHFLETLTGSKGPHGIAFKNPIALALDPQGNLYVSDSLNEQVQKIAPDKTLLGKIGRQNQGEGQLDAPNSIAVDFQGNVYVADQMTRLIQKFDRDGHFVTMWPVETKKPFDAMKDDTTLQIGADETGATYVVDHVDNLVKKYDSTGKFLLEWGGPGSKEGQFKGAYSPYVDSDGNIFIADAGNARIQKFDSQGNFLFQLKLPDDTYPGERMPGPAIPTTVAVDRQGNIYTTLISCSCLKKFDREGRFLLEWGRPPPGQNRNDGQFTGPNGIALDGAGNVYVMDMQNFHCTNCGLQKFDGFGHLLGSWYSQWSPSPIEAAPILGNGEFGVISAIAVDAAGNIYVAEPGYARIQKLR